MASPGGPFFSDIVGADDMLAGRTAELRWVEAEGNTLRITLVRPAGDFLARLALPFACPVPAGVPVNPDGISVPVASAGPYYVAAGSGATRSGCCATRTTEESDCRSSMPSRSRSVCRWRRFG